ncbi:MAG: hypothetical protein Kapaf2KO_23690 [Candidatus Kapaibacteriales bacterium]
MTLYRIILLSFFLVYSSNLFPQTSSKAERESAKKGIYNSIDSLDREKELKQEELEKYQRKIDYKENSTRFYEPEYGIGGGVALPLNVSSPFNSINEELLPCCGDQNFTHQSGYSFFGTFTNNFFKREFYNIGFSFNFTQFQNEFSSTENIIIASNTGGSDELEVEHTLDLASTILSFEPYYSYNLFDNFYIKASAIAAHHLQSTGSQISQENNENIDFATSTGEATSQWGESTADIDNTSQFMYGLGLSLYYNFILSKSSYITAEAGYRDYLNSALSDRDLDLNTVGFGLTYSYNFSSESDLRDKEMMIEEKDEIQRDINDLASQRMILLQGLDKISQDSVIAQRELEKDSLSKLRVKYDSLSIYSIDNGIARNVKSVKVKQFSKKLSIPVLPVLFYDEEEYTLGLRYSQQLISFKERNVFDIKALGETRDLIKINHNLLNIVGKRMLDNPGSVLTIIGNSDGSANEIADSTGYKRALSTKFTLMNTFSLPDSNFKIVYRESPDYPSNSPDTRAAEENRRVELYSEDGLLDPIEIDNYLDSRLEDKLVEVRLNYDIPLGLQSINYTLYNYYSNDEHYLEFNDITTKKASAFIRLDSIYEVNDIQEDLEIVFDLTPNVGSRISDAGFIGVNIEEYVPSNQSEEYYLYEILMPFSADKVNEADPAYAGIESKLNNMNSYSDYKIDLIGWTDNIGDPAFNKELSQKRVEAMLESLSDRLNGLEYNTEAKGMSDKYDNSLPEGRFLNRRVAV